MMAGDVEGAQPRSPGPSRSARMWGPPGQGRAPSRAPPPRTPSRGAQELRANEARDRIQAKPSDDGHDEDEDAHLGAERLSQRIAEQIDIRKQWQLGRDRRGP